MVINVLLFLEDVSPFCGGTLMETSSLCFKARVGSLIHAEQRRTCHTFPEIDLWCDTCRPLGGQHRCT